MAQIKEQIKTSEKELNKREISNLSDREFIAALIHRNKHREAAKIRKQRGMAQMKEQVKTREKELNKMEIIYQMQSSKHW